MTSNYLTALPRKFMRAMAGFRIEGTYHIKRAEVTPPDLLAKEIFPEVDRWLSFVESRRDRADLAAQGFLRLVSYLKIVFLQDSAILMQTFPNHPLWRLPVFVTSEYAAFAHEVRQHNASIETPMDVQIRQALPLVADQLVSVRDSVNSKTDYWGRKSETGMKKLEDLLVDVYRQGTGELRGTLVIQRDAGVRPSNPVQLPISRPPTLINAAGSSSPVLLGSTTTTQNLAQTQMPNYTMSRTLNTVAELWREWNAGIGGGPSVKDLDSEWGTKWRTTPKEAVWYGQRRYLICRIEQDAESLRLPIERLIEELDATRVAKGWSLDRLIKESKKGWSLRT